MMKGERNWNEIGMSSLVIVEIGMSLLVIGKMHNWFWNWHNWFWQNGIGINLLSNQFVMFKIFG